MIGPPRNFSDSDEKTAKTNGKMTKTVQHTNQLPFNYYSCIIRTVFKNYFLNTEYKPH